MLYDDEVAVTFVNALVALAASICKMRQESASFLLLGKMQWIFVCQPELVVTTLGASASK